MSTNDGTAVFEKRKFADNSKLSTPSTWNVSVSLDPEDFNIGWNSNVFTAPHDGYFYIVVSGVKNFFIVSNIGWSGSRAFIETTENPLIVALTKNETIGLYKQYDSLSFSVVKFVFAKSAT